MSTQLEQRSGGAGAHGRVRWAGMGRVSGRVVGSNTALRGKLGAETSIGKQLCARNYRILKTFGKGRSIVVWRNRSGQ